MPLATNKSDSLRISVIIPCKNEASSIRDTLAQAALADAHQVIVVDGGSTDSTLEIVRAHAPSATLLETKLSHRAMQMNVASEQASGEVILFLHADTMLPQNALSAIRSLYLSGTEVGCFRRHFTPRTRLLDITSKLAHLRSKLFFWCYGDQAIFITSKVFRRLGGYREISIMEDLDLCLRAKKLCHFNVINSPIQTSARRFADAPLKVLLSDFWLSLRFILGFYQPK